MRSLFVAATVLLFVTGRGPAHAEGIFISAPDRVDVAYDDARGVLYISDGGELLRYQRSSGSLLAPLVLGGTLGGMDISPDGQSLVVADNTYSGGQLWVYIVDLATLATQKISFSQGFSEGGTFTAAYGSDGSILITSQFLGSGTVGLRRYVPSTSTTTTLGSISQNSMLRASADHSVIAIAESNSSDGPFDRYRVSDGDLLRESGYANGTSWFNYEIAVSPDDQQYAIPTYDGTFFTDSMLVKQTTMVGVYASGQPIGVAYNPVGSQVYFPWAGTSDIYVYDRTTLTQIGSYDFESQFTGNGNYAFVSGRVKTSQDGSLLFGTVAGGVRYVTVDAVAPSALTASAANSAVTLHWTASSNGTSYLVYQATSPGGESMTAVESGVTGSSVTISGLTNGTTYYFKVAAATPAGLSTPCTEASATPLAPPAAVTGLQAAGGNGVITLAWNAAAGATAYTVYKGTVSGGETTVATGVLSNGYLATALTNGVTYYFQVAATNSLYTGPKSMEVAAMAVSPPSAPTGLAATAGDASVKLQWSASNLATSYTVHMGTGSGAESSIATLSGITGTSVTVTGLSDGITYYFKITAVNASGTSPYSNESSATPMVLPVAVDNLSATAGDKQVTLNWSPAAGASSYSVFQGTHAGGESTSPVMSGVTGATAIVTGLTDGTAYYFTVAASNAAGVGAASNEASATPLAPPAVPSSLTATPGNGQVSLSWTASSGATAYDVYEGTRTGGESATPVLTVSSGTSVAVTGLSNGTAYYFKVAAVNSIATGAASQEASATPVDNNTGKSSGGGAFDWSSLLLLASLAWYRCNRNGESARERASPRECNRP